MRTHSIVLPLLLLAASSSIGGQGPAIPAAPQSTESTSLPVRRVVLYKTGVGYFEHLGGVRDRQDVAIRFTSNQLNDVLKSLTTLDLGKGRIAGISYNSIAPIEQRLGALRIPVGSTATTFDLLGSLRGARLEVTSGTAATEGRLLSVERRAQVQKDVSAHVEVFSILTDIGEVRTFELTPAVKVRIVDRDLRQEVSRYLDVVGSSREQDVRRMVISTAGTGERQLFVSYISEVPIWKSTYRLVMADKAKPLLQGWAIVDNTIGEDWTDVELSLVAGAPQSFIQPISQPYYGRRPTVPLPTTAQITPQTHQATLTAGTGRVSGRVTDPAGGVLPGVTVTLSGPAGTSSTVTSSIGEYELAAAAGEYSLQFELTGFGRLRIEGLGLVSGATATQNATLTLGALQETVTVRADTRASGGGIGSGAGGGSGGGVYRPGRALGGVASPAPPPPPAAPAAVGEAYQVARELQAAAQGGDLGDLFEYRIKEPVTLRKNQSALVPIINTEITAEKVVLWNRASGSGRPLRAVWLSNRTGYTLDGGSITVIDGNAFAGEGLIEPLKAGERRLVSYAAELGVLVNAKQESTAARVTRIRIADGVMVHESEERAAWTYTARNETKAPVALIIDHRTRPGWKVAEPLNAEETTADSHRFRLNVDPAKESSLAVREARGTQTSVSISDLTDQYLASGMRPGFFAEDVLRTLKPVIDKRVEIATVDSRVERLESEKQTIVSDQQRLRENMKALRGSAEEKQLLQRYTRQLDGQETRLEELQRELAQATEQRDKLRAELTSLIEKLSFETVPK